MGKTWWHMKYSFSTWVSNYIPTTISFSIIFCQNRLTKKVPICMHLNSYLITWVLPYYSFKDRIVCFLITGDLFMKNGLGWIYLWSIIFFMAVNRIQEGTYFFLHILNLSISTFSSHISGRYLFKIYTHVMSITFIFCITPSFLLIIYFSSLLYITKNNQWIVIHIIKCVNLN